MRTTKKRIRRIVTGMICLLLMFTLAGCQIKIDIPGLGQIRLGDSKEEKEDAESKKQKKTKKPDSGKKPETTDTDKPISPEESLANLRKSMDGTLQQFAVAYLGYVEADYVDHVQEWIEKKYPDLLSKMTFIKEIGTDRIYGHGPAELFCIVPRSGEDPVSVGRMELNYDTGISEIVESLYQSETGEPFLVMCNGENEGIGGTMVSMGTEAGYQADWVPMMGTDGHVWLPTTENNVEQAKDFTDYKACDASRFTDWYGDVHENIQEADLIGSCWEFGVDEYNSDIFGDYFVELLDNGYARISWSEKEYGIEDYSDIIYEIYEGTWSCTQQDGHPYLSIQSTRTGGEWYYEGENPVNWSEDYRVYISTDGTMLLLENQEGFAGMPSKTGIYHVLSGFRTN